MPFVTLLGNVADRASALAEFRKPIDVSNAAQPRILLISLKNREGILIFSCLQYSLCCMCCWIDTDDG